MRAAMALLSLFPEHDVAAPAAPATPEASSVGIAPPTATTAIAPVSAARAAGLQQLAHLWRADEVAQATCRDTTVASGFAALDAELPGGGWPQGQLIELLFDAHGIGELSLLAPALTRCTQDARACVWVLPCERGAPVALPNLPYPPALAAAGIDLAHALFVQPETPREAFWTIEQSLRAAHLGALVGWLPHTSSSREESVEISSRALQGRAEQRTRTEEYGEQRRREIGPRSRKIHTFEGEFRAMRRLQLLAGRQQAPVFLLRDMRALHAPSPAALRLQLAVRDGELAVTILKRRGRPLLEPVALQVHPAHWRHAEAPAPADGVHAAQPQSAGRLAQAALLVQRWSAKAIFSH